MQGSTQSVLITKIKKEPNDKTISLSIMIVAASNGDFDGDEMNFFMVNDHYMYSLFDTFRPHYNIPDITKPYTISGNLTLFSPSNNILSNAVKGADIGDDSVYARTLQ